MCKAHIEYIPTKPFVVKCSWRTAVNEGFDSWASATDVLVEAAAAGVVTVGMRST